MNYLAHIYLSGNNNLVTIGNFIADGIKGKDYTKYHKDIQTGILLHRHIDTFTDAHAIVRKSTKRLHENYGHYAGVIVDIFYDHYLAKNWNKYSSVPLNEYVNCFYELLQDQYDILPLRIKKMMPYMISGNWLLSYASLDGIAKVLQGMNTRTKNRSGMDKATKELDMFYLEFENEFTLFFEELITFTKEKQSELSSK